MRLQVGQRSPDFITLDIAGNPISLENYRGKNLVLLFNRYAGCPFCHSKYNLLVEAFPKYKQKGLEVIEFFQSPKESIVEYYPQTPPFPVVSDYNRVIYNQYGIESSIMGALGLINNIPTYITKVNSLVSMQGKVDGDIALLPAAFLVDPALTIIQAHYGKDWGDQIGPPDIDEFLFTK